MARAGRGRGFGPKDEVAEVETEKMNGPVEVQVSGMLRRRIAAEGDVIRVGGMLAVIAPADASDEEIDAFVVRETAARTAADTVREPPRAESVSTSLGPVRALVLGDGPEAAVFLHGFGGDALNWRFNIEELHGARRAIAIDLPGHGESTKDVGEGAADELALVAWETIEALGVTRVHLVGHSLGGLVAARLAAGHPDEVASLALIAPAGFGATINADFIDGFAAASSRRELKAVLPLLFVDQNLVGRELVEDILRYKRAEGVSEALTAIRDRLFPAGTQAVSVIEDVSGLDVPSLVLWERTTWSSWPIRRARRLRTHGWRCLTGWSLTTHRGGSGGQRAARRVPVPTESVSSS